MKKVEFGIAPLMTIGAAAAFYCSTFHKEPGAWLGSIIDFVEIYFVFFLIGGLVWGLGQLVDDKIKKDSSKWVVLGAFLVLCWLFSNA